MWAETLNFASMPKNIILTIGRFWMSSVHLLSVFLPSSIMSLLCSKKGEIWFNSCIYEQVPFHSPYSETFHSAKGRRLVPSISFLDSLTSVLLREMGQNKWKLCPLSNSRQTPPSPVCWCAHQTHSAHCVTWNYLNVPTFYVAQFRVFFGSWHLCYQCNGKQPFKVKVSLQICGVGEINQLGRKNGGLKF